MQQEPRPPLPPVTCVFADVPRARSLVGSKQHAGQLQLLHKAIQRCMQRLMSDLPGGDGYLCHCCDAEPQLRYMVAFTSPVRAAQWCMLLQVGCRGAGFTGTLQGIHHCRGSTSKLAHTCRCLHPMQGWAVKLRPNTWGH